MDGKPILFSGPMVRAMLDGRKTQTRRIVKPNGGGLWAGLGYPRALDDTPVKTRPGDRLWVREGFFYAPPSAYRLSAGIDQTADPTDPDRAAVYRVGFNRSGRPVWKPSIHMPRWASRLTLTVTDVRIERLQEISEGDAVAEGTQEPSLRDLGGDLAQAAMSERQVFKRLWDSINGDGAWDSNPWVAAYSFTVEHQNIDARGAA